MKKMNHEATERTLYFNSIGFFVASLLRGKLIEWPSR